MNIQPLCSGLMFKVCDLERRQRMQRMGFLTAPGFRPVREDISGIIETQLLVPLVAELRRITGKPISYSRWGDRRVLPALDRRKTVCPHIPAKSKYRPGIFQKAPPPMSSIAS